MTRKAVATIMNNFLIQRGETTNSEEILEENVLEIPPSRYEEECLIDYKIYVARFRTSMVSVTVYSAGNYSVQRLVSVC